jgi:hypothetical protein
VSRETAHDTRLPHRHADFGRAACQGRVFCPMCVEKVCLSRAKCRPCA